MLLDRHRAKIVDLEALLPVLGTRPRSFSVVLCHGVFDVVHPGHMRHLLYAKSKADVLVCSVTADRHITKGPHRPHVPEELRAGNLALLDIVDHVVVSDEDVPLGLLGRMQPDFYAKGFEYSSAKRTGPIPEAAVVEGYGGEVLFTPGEHVYSSTALLEQAAPDLRWEKLALVMERAQITASTLRAVLSGMPDQLVHVVGDTIVDRLSYCEVIGANGKTPTVSVRRARVVDFAGGAAIVARHARAAGASVQFTTVVGDDKPGLFALDEMRSSGVDVFPVVDRARPTTVKEAIVAGGYRLLKIDTVDNRSISDAVLRSLCGRISETEGGAVVFSDFRHGMFNARTIPSLTAAIPAGCLRVADSQVASRWGNITEFRGFDLITPNEREARFALGDQDSGVRPLAARLREAADCGYLLMKMGERGVLGFAAGMLADGSFALDAMCEDVRDPVGAGDAFLAYATLSLLIRPCLATAAILGTLAAGLECSYDGNVPVTASAMLARVDQIEEALRCR